MDKQLVCFIDLLGTKESSKVSEEEFSEAIGTFRDTLKKSMSLLKHKSEIRQFSDCAFMALNLNADTITFLDNVRETLFSKGYYFKCSLNPGEFHVEIDEDESAGFSSVTFGASSIGSYLLHEDFKGLGYVISPQVNEYDSEIAKAALKNLIHSVYIGGSNRNEVIPYLDIRFRTPYIGNNDYCLEKKEGRLIEGEDNHSSETNFEKFLEDFMIAKTKNENYAKYYVPTLITMIHSSDFSDICYSDEEGWTGTPLIFYKLFLESRTSRRILSIPRSEIVYCAAIEKVYKDADFVSHDKYDIVKDKLAAFFVKSQKIKRGISSVPNYVFSGLRRNDFIKRIAKFELSM